MVNFDCHMVQAAEPTEEGLIILGSNLLLTKGVAERIVA
jgi:hypothetical protein